MDKKFPVLVIEDTARFKKGTILESYKKVDDGIEVSDDFLNESKYILLTEALSKEDEKKIRDMIREQMKLIFWNLYTKQGVIVGSL
jgi:hypothetical protein